VNFDLDEKVNELETVEVIANSVERTAKRMETGVTNLSIKNIRKIPTFLGEVDVIKSLFTLPGVTSMGEGSSGFNVRGGNIDQNLVLLDEAPIFNTSHLLGFFSVFNPDVVRDIDFYRGGVPVSYGGRTSSVLAVNLREPNAQKFSAGGGIGTISSRLFLETPLIKDKLSIFLAGRVSYVNTVVKALNIKRLQGGKADFYDLTAKLDFRPTSKDRISFTAFLGNDVFQLAKDTLSGIDANTSSEFNWQSRASSLAWSHFFSKKLSVKSSLAYSDYSSGILNEEPSTGFELTQNVAYLGFKTAFEWTPNEKHTVEFGGQFSRYDIQPSEISPFGDLSNKNFQKLRNDAGTETALFVGDEWKIAQKLSIGLGSRWVIFQNVSKGYVFDYAPGLPIETFNQTDSTLFSSGANAVFSGFEPRLTLNWTLNDKTNIKLGVTRMQQFVQLLSSTISALPTDRWKLSDRFIKPQISDQFSLGIFRNFKRKTIETSVEFFYKNLTNVNDFKDGSTLLLNDFPETAILQGNGYAYGAEVFIKKNTGLFTGWLSYTYSQSRITVNGDNPASRINNGLPFQPIFNRPHILNLVSTYQMGKRVSFSTNFTYSSGRTITYPTSKILVSGIVLPFYNARNNGRIPDYIRLDASFNLESHPYRESGYRSTWNLSFYNLLARNNAYSVFFRVRNQSLQYYRGVDIFKLSIIGAIVPSLTYNFKF
jgi:hypothetical protein